MRIVVCAKQVPDPNAVVYRIDPGRKPLVRDGVPNILHPGDEVALEPALRLAERDPGSSVTVVSMGPESAAEAIRRALAMGATDGVLVTDPQLAGSDALGTARALAAAIGRQGFDIIFCATESTDGYTGMVPGMLAELLAIPHLSFVRKLDVTDRDVIAQRVTGLGYQVLHCALPLLVTIASGSNEPRYPALKGIMAARRKQLQTLDSAALGLAPADGGEAGARERVRELVPVEERAAGEIVVDDGTGAVKIVDLLEQRGVL